MRVLGVHQDAAVCTALRQALEPVGCQVLTACSAVEALEQLDHSIPEVLFVQPRCCGDEAGRLISTLHQRCPHSALIALVDKNQEELAVEALRQGAGNYLLLPLRPPMLLAMIERVRERIANRERQARVIDHIVRKRTEIRFPSDLSLVPAVVEYIIVRVAESAPDCETNGLQLGLEETLRNAIEHGNLEIGFDEKAHALADGTLLTLIDERRQQEPYRSRQVRVEFSIEDGTFHCEIEDEGRGFDFRKLWDPLTDRGLERLNGRGIFLTRTFFDEVNYKDRGNRVELVKHLNSEIM